MNILEIQQPYASLLVKGICDATHIDEEVLQKFKRYYIFASDLMISDAAMPLTWRQEVFNQQQYGNLPDYEKLPVRSLVGYVDWNGHATPNANVWTASIKGTSEFVRNAHEFDVPYQLPLQFLKEHGMYELLFQSHVSLNPQPYLAQYGHEIIFPTSFCNFTAASRRGSFVLEMTHSLSLLLNEMEEIIKMTVHFGSRAKTFLFNAEIITLDDYDEDGNRHQQLLLTFDHPDHG